MSQLEWHDVSEINELAESVDLHSQPDSTFPYVEHSPSSVEVLTDDVSGIIVFVCLSLLLLFVWVSLFVCFCFLFNLFIRLHKQKQNQNHSGLYILVTYPRTNSQVIKMLWKYFSFN